MTSPSANVTDVVFDFCGVLIDWQTRACLEGRYPQVVVDRICADNDPCGFYDYEDRMDHGEDFEAFIPTWYVNRAKRSRDFPRLHRTLRRCAPPHDSGYGTAAS